MLSSGFLGKIRSRVDRLDRDILRDLVVKFSDEQEFFQRILDSMMEGVIVTDNRDLIQYVNRTATILLGKKSKYLLWKSIPNALECSEFCDLVNRAVHGGERIRNREVRLRGPAERILNVHVFPLLREGGVYGNVIIFMDITREKEEQRRLRRAESMAALSNITAGIAHEIKNPLGAVSIHLQLLERAVEESDGPGREKMERYLGVVREEMARLNDIVVDFLDAIRPLKVVPVRTDLEELLSGVRDLFAPDFREKGVGFELEVGAFPEKPLLDPKLMRQVLVNLVKNAGEAISGNGIVKVSAHSEGDMLLITVEDNGCGIEPERIHSVFEPYNTSKPQGTGLGLTIVYRIVREHGGSVHLDSRSGEGTRFVLKLPMMVVEQKRLGR